MNPTLNQADVRLLKSIFVTKTDLSKFEKRLNQRFAARKQIEELELVLAKTFSQIESEFRSRLNKLEQVVGISPSA